MRRTTSRPQRARLRAACLAAGAVCAALALTGTAPASASSEDALVGTVVRAYGEDVAAHDATHDATHDAEAPELLTWVESDDASVRVPTEDLASVETGAVVEVVLGGEVEDAPAEAGAEPAREVLDADVVEAAPEPSVAAATTAAATAAHEVTVVMAVPAGTTRDSTTLAQVVAEVEGPVNSYWSGQTGGAVTFQVTDRQDWTTLAASCRQYDALWAEAAAAVGWSEGPGKHLLVYVPSTPATVPGCYDGLGQVGSGTASGGKLYVRHAMTSVIAHELGHNLGLNHAAGHQCDGATEGPASGCLTTTYRDYYDVMGISWQRSGSLSPQLADQLGVLPSSARVDVPASGGTWTLSATGGGTGLRALRLADSAGPYWLEYRAAVGQDSWLSTSGTNPVGLDAGVLVRRSGSGPGGDATLLLDATPSSRAAWGGDFRAALRPGSVITLGSSRWRVGVQSTTATTAVVTVEPLGSSGPAVTGGIRIAWDASGARGGPLGQPLREAVCGIAQGGCGQDFQNGSIFWTPATGAHTVYGGIGLRWNATGREVGTLGYPLREAVCGIAQGGCAQDFQNGSIFWTPATGAHSTYGGIGIRWNASGREVGGLGYPLREAVCGLVQGGCGQEFQRGAVFWAPATGARAVTGPTLGAWNSTGRERGRLGYPAGELVRTSATTVEQRFQGGVLRAPVR